MNIHFEEKEQVKVVEDNETYYDFKSPEELEAIINIFKKHTDIIENNLAIFVVPKMIEYISLNDEYRMLHNTKISTLGDGFIYKNGDFEYINVKIMTNLIYDTYFEAFIAICKYLKQNDKLSEAMHIKSFVFSQLKWN